MLTLTFSSSFLRGKMTLSFNLHSDVMIFAANFESRRSKSSRRSSLGELISHKYSSGSIHADSGIALTVSRLQDKKKELFAAEIQLNPKS